jgi:hypothetical protein
VVIRHLAFGAEQGNPVAEIPEAHCRTPPSSVDTPATAYGDTPQAPARRQMP